MLLSGAFPRHVPLTLSSQEIRASRLPAPKESNSKTSSPITLQLARIAPISSPMKTFAYRHLEALSPRPQFWAPESPQAVSLLCFSLIPPFCYPEEKVSNDLTAVYATATSTPPGPTSKGTTKSCGKYYTPQSGDTCEQLLESRNPSM